MDLIPWGVRSRNDFLFSDLGETELRCFEDPVKLWELMWQDEETR